MRKIVRAAAVALVASLVAGCSHAGQSLVPSTASSDTAPSVGNAASVSPQMRDASTGNIKHVFFSRQFLREHPQALQPAATSSTNLMYQGGPVETSPRIYLVFWGFSGPSDTAHDPAGEAAYLIDFFKSIGGSTWLATDTQYYQNARGRKGYVGNARGQLTGVWYDTTNTVLPVYQDSDVAAEAVRAVKHFGYSPNANYFVVTPADSAEPGFAAEWCAYHSTVKDGAVPVAYTDFPYQPDASENCGMHSVNTPGTLDGVSIVGGHEEAETQTDPGAGNGWIDSSGSEIGDKCAWVSLQNTKFPDGSSFPTQPLWSNKTASCVQSY